MSIRKTITLTALLALAVFTLPATPAAARDTREFLGSFGSIDELAGIAVDQETGNIYVVSSDQRTIERENNVIYVFGPNGGSPVDGVPSQITGLELDGDLEGYPAGIAIDNSCYEHVPRLAGKACEEYDPSYGDLYTTNQGQLKNVQKFKLNPGHGYQLVESGPGDSEDMGITVDSRGDLFLISEGYPQGAAVTEYKKTVEKVVNGKGEEEFKEHLEPVTIPQSITGRASYVAVDDVGHVYVGAFDEGGYIGGLEYYRGVGKLNVDENGKVLSEEVLTRSLPAVEYRPIAVDRATGTVFVGTNTEVEEFNVAGAPQLTFGSAEALGGSLGRGFGGAVGVAVDEERGLVYVANRLHGDVDVFGGEIAQPVIEVGQPPASGLTRTSALIAGRTNPESGGANYYFQYVTGGEYEPGAAEPYINAGRTAIQSLVGGRVSQTVERVALTGLLPGTTYHYRMVVVNSAGTTFGPDETFTTAAATPPVAVTGSAVEVSATGVTLTGMVGPRGLPTSYVFEVGTDTGYVGARLFGNAGSSTGEVPVSVGVQYLVPGTTYHYRLSATSFDGTSYGVDGTFTTPAVVASIAQPASESLIASQSLPFPSIAGAITHALGQGGHRGKPSAGARRRKALRACARERSRKQRSLCEARARRAR